MKKILQEKLALSIKAKEDFLALGADQLIACVEQVVKCFQQDNKIIIFGNGGSAADAQHMAAEFVNRFLIDRRPLPALALTTDSSIITSIGNDFSYDDIFLKQLQAFGQKGDIAFGISTSGNSPNVISALQEARKKGLYTVALTGGDGGKIKGLVDILLNVPCSHTPHIQECHLWIEHMVCLLVDELMFGLCNDHLS